MIFLSSGMGEVDLGCGPVTFRVRANGMGRYIKEEMAYLFGMKKCFHKKF